MNQYFQKFLFLVTLSLLFQINFSASGMELGEEVSEQSSDPRSLKRSREGDDEAGKGKEKKQRIDDQTSSDDLQDLSEIIGQQTFGMPTLDTAFKYLLHDKEILLEFIKLFGETPNITSAKLLDQSLNPIKELKEARSLLHKQETKKFFKKIKETDEENLQVQTCASTGNWMDIGKGVKILKELSEVYDEIREALPGQERNSQLDVVCQLSDKNYVLVEVQVARQDYWDDRALAYAGAFYGNQLKKGGSWKDLKKVIAINILGGGTEETSHWKGASSELMRHYKFVSEVGDKKHEIDSLQLIQYNIMFSKFDTIESKELREWIELLQQAHKKTDADLEKVETDIVKQAYERLRIKKMPDDVKEKYIHDFKKYEKFSQLVAQEKEESHKQGFESGIEKGREDNRKEVVKQMVTMGLSDNVIAEANQITLEQLQEIKASLINERT